MIDMPVVVTGRFCLLLMFRTSMVGMAGVVVGIYLSPYCIKTVHFVHPVERC